MTARKPDLSEFEAVSPRIGVLCWGTRLTPDQRDRVMSAREAGHSFRTIARVVSGWGFKVTASSVTNHVKGECQCPR
jgi:hypothetical protein